MKTSYSFPTSQRGMIISIQPKNPDLLILVMMETSPSEQAIPELRIGGWRIEQATSQEPTLSSALEVCSLDRRTLQATYSHSWSWASLNARSPKGSREKLFLHGRSGMTSFPTDFQHGKNMRRLNSSSARPDASGLQRVLLKPRDSFKQLQQAQIRQEETSASLGRGKPGHPEDAGGTEQGDPKIQWTQVSVCIPATERAKSKDSGRRGQAAQEQQEATGSGAEGQANQTSLSPACL